MIFPLIIITSFCYTRLIYQKPSIHISFYNYTKLQSRNVNNRILFQNNDESMLNHELQNNYDFWTTL